MGPRALAPSVLKANSESGAVLVIGENNVHNYCEFFSSENLLVNNFGEGILNF